MKVGDLVRFKKSAIRANHTVWLNTCAQNKTPMLVLKEYTADDRDHALACVHAIPPWDVPSQSPGAGRYFEVMCEEVSIHAFESELTKRGV